MQTAARPPKPPGQGLASTWTQMYPPKPTFTEKDIPDLTDKVFIVTGASSGVGKETARVLYSKNALVYVAVRSQARADRAISDIKASQPASKGRLEFLHLDLADLESVRAAARRFLEQEAKLHVLFNNAAVNALYDTDGSHKTAQGHEIHLGVNVIGPFLFTRLLTPILVATAKAEAPGTVRVVWVSSMGLEATGEKSLGLSLDYLKYWPAVSPLERYGLSKAGNWLHAVEMAQRFKEEGVISMPVNPGHLASELYRDGSCLFRMMLKAFALYPCINGAYTELFAALSPTITNERSGEWSKFLRENLMLKSDKLSNNRASVVPWGRFYPIRRDLLDATRSEAEGGNGHAKKFWDWSEDEVREFL
ncbi:hypothetical protein CDD83_3117 [Cordyceps sp. RAO-2017]|nr:hypothetical protein CDD83_3117 [Cordyceps sp. RAO-2017]